MAAAFHLSYQGLPDDQRWLFGLLALHPGRDIPVRSAAALVGHGLAETERLLDRLDEAHLIIRLPGGYTRFHDLVRVYAIEHVTAHGASRRPGRTCRSAAARLRVVPGVCR